MQLVEVAGLRGPCDLDLLLFFSRHPRVVLSSEQLAVAGRGQGDDLVLLPVLADDVERLRADRSGGTEDGDPPHQVMPSATTR